MGNFMLWGLWPPLTHTALTKACLFTKHNKQLHNNTISNIWASLVQVTDEHIAKQFLEPKPDAIKAGSSSDVR
jgi:hypothetical protein